MGLMNKRTLLLGGLAVAAVAGALKNRERVAGLIGVRTGASEPPRPEPAASPPPERPAAPPAPANYDLSGPAANTATPVPAPEPLVHGEGAIDERAEEEAAAAEAAAIGGSAPEYAGLEPGELAGEAERPLMEAGEGDSEGQEQAEADLRDNAEPAAGDPLEGGRRIEATIEAADDPFAGERLEGTVSEPPREQTRFFAGGKGDEGGGEPEEGPAAGLPDENAAEAAERAAEGETPPEKKSSAVWSRGDDDTGEWQTWSGRASDD